MFHLAQRKDYKMVETRPVGPWLWCSLVLCGVGFPCSFLHHLTVLSLPSTMTWAPCPHGVRTREKKHTWEQNPQPQWKAYPAAAMAWQEELAPSNSQIDEQAQLLWALSDRSVPRYRKPPPAQPKSPKSTAITPKRAEREVSFLSPEERASPRPHRCAQRNAKRTGGLPS